MPLYTIFLNSIKLPGYKTVIKFDNSILIVKQNNFASKILNFYIAYDLDTWQKSGLFGATNIVKHNFKENWVYSSSVIAFDEKCEWNFDFAENVIIFGVDNSSSSHADNQKTNFLVLGEGPTYGINGSFGTPEMMTINYNDYNNDDKNYFFLLS